jgi:hypothetical protein
VAVRHSPLTGPPDGCASLAATCVASAPSGQTPALTLAASGAGQAAPAGGAAGQADRQPLTLDPITSAPLAPVAPPATTVTRPAGDLGFAPTLPYPGALPEGGTGAGSGSAAAAAAGPAGPQAPASPARFAAGALLLAAVAAHLACWGRRILRPAAS